MNQLYLNIKEGNDSVAIEDLGIIELKAPLSNYPLLEPEGFLTLESVLASQDLKDLIAQDKVYLTKATANSEGVTNPPETGGESPPAPPSLEPVDLDSVEEVGAPTNFPPQIRSVSAKLLPLDFLTRVTLNGAFFTPNMRVTCSDEDVSLINYKFVNDNQIEYDLYSRVPRRVDLTLDNGQAVNFEGVQKLVRPNSLDFTDSSETDGLEIANSPNADIVIPPSRSSSQYVRGSTTNQGLVLEYRGVSRWSSYAMVKTIGAVLPGQTRTVNIYFFPASYGACILALGLEEEFNAKALSNGTNSRMFGEYISGSNAYGSYGTLVTDYGKFTTILERYEMYCLSFFVSHLEETISRSLFKITEYKSQLQRNNLLNQYTYKYKLNSGKLYPVIIGESRSATPIFKKVEIL